MGWAGLQQTVPSSLEHNVQSTTQIHKMSPRPEVVGPILHEIRMVMLVNYWSLSMLCPWMPTYEGTHIQRTYAVASHVPSASIFFSVRFPLWDLELAS